MIFEGYQNLKIYSSQSKFTLPKSSKDGLQGKGNLVFLVTPSIEKSINVLSDPSMAFTTCLYKYFSMDSFYKRKISNKTVLSNERNKLRKLFSDNKNLKISYKPNETLQSIIESKKNLIYDLSRWTELFFIHRKVQNTKKMCQEFFDILFSRIQDHRFDGYQKLLLIDLNSWCSASDCVLMNRRLLNNPLSIIFYTAYYYPEIISQYPDIRIMVMNRNAGQVFLMNLHDIDKKTYPMIKNKVKSLKNLVISVEDETSTEEMTDEEVKAELVEDFKTTMKTNLKNNLLGKNDYPVDPFNELPEDSEPFDITSELEDEDAEISPEDNDNEEADPLDEVVSNEVDNILEDNPEDIIFDDTKRIADDKAEVLKKKVYVQSFIPQRTKEQLAKIERLTSQQNLVIPPTMEEAKKNSIETTLTGANIINSNPNIMESKFMNFDKDYVKNCMESDIDNSVKILSEASNKIFITNKNVVDSSDPMNLKKTYRYTLQDEKGNQMTLKFDIPVIIDGTYIYINGSKKIIGHQFILKPIVKTSPDAVQIVTAYNKVFIYRRGIIDKNTSILEYYLPKNKEKFKVVDGNFSMMNTEYECPLDFIMLSKFFAEFKIGNFLFKMNIDDLIKYADRKNPSHKKPDLTKELPVAFDESVNELIMLPLTDSYTEFVFSKFDEKDLAAMRRVKRKPKLIVASAKMMKKFVPIIVFAMFCEGFTSVMRKANVNYRFITKDQLRDIDLLKWDYIQLEDCILIWEQKDTATAMLMNGLKQCPMDMISKDNLDNKDTMVSLIAYFFNDDTRIAYSMENFRDFLLDEKAKEMLSHFGYPTDLVSLLITAVRMLSDNKFKPENNMENMRIRSTEVISDIVYKLVTDAYNDYRKTSNKKKPTKISIPQSKVIDSLLASSTTVKAGKQSIATNLVAEFSTLNPVLELEKARAVTFKGIRGIQMDRALTLNRRAYDESMLGVVGISTSPDANVGVVRELTLEPNITSTRGYMDVKNKAGVDDLNSANLFTAAELLTPIGVTHDDPDRTSMSYKQTKYMVPVADSDPVLIGNRVEAVVPYLLSDEFVVDAKEDGQVVDVTPDWVVVKYKSGKNYAIDISPRVKKNASAGFFVDNTLKCDLKLGDKFKKGDVLAYNDKQFTKHTDDNGASMNLGVLTKIAISSSWDIYEDSTPITTKLSERLATEMIDEKPIVLKPNTMVDYIVKIGQQVKTGDLLIKFSETLSDEMQTLFNSLRDNDKLGKIAEDTKTTIRAKHTGEVVDIKIYTTVPIEELDPSLAKIVSDYQKKIKSRNKVLDKYANEDDVKYYEAGQIISEVAEVMTPSKNGKIKGQYIDQGVLILFYVKYKDVAAKGDKIVANFALKGVTSHVIEEGYEPYSEYRPDEEISTIIAPLAVAARKTPSIFIAMFGNKLLIEAKRQLKDIYLNGKEPPAGYKNKKKI